VLAVLSVLIVLSVIVFLIERNWLTNGERKVAKVGLAQVEQLESLLGCNCERFETVDKQAKATVEISNQKAWTLLDHAIASVLSLYLEQVELVQRQDSRETAMKLFVKQRHLEWYSDPKLNKESHESQVGIFKEFSSALHKKLD